MTPSATANTPSARERAVIAYGPQHSWRGRLFENPVSPAESLKRLHTVLRAYAGSAPAALESAAREIVEEHAGIDELAPDEHWSGRYWFGSFLCHEPDGAPTLELIEAGLFGTRPEPGDPAETIWLLRPGGEILEDIGWMLRLDAACIFLEVRDPQHPDAFAPVVSARLDDDVNWPPLIRVADAIIYALRDQPRPAPIAPQPGTADRAGTSGDRRG